jgi:hypothetical protein
MLGRGEWTVDGQEEVDKTEEKRGENRRSKPGGRRKHERLSGRDERSR